MKSENRAFKYTVYFGLLSAIFMVTLVSTQSVNAMVVRGGDSYQLEPYATLEDDLYVLGESIAVAGTTTGDVFAVGSYVEHSGVIAEDVFIAGGNIKITGEVKGDLRIVGGKVFISGHVTEDLIIAGGTVTIAKDADIDGDLFVFADYLVLEGTVEGLAELHVRLTEITGTIGDNVRAGVREAISLKGDAHVYGDFTYEAPREAFISETAKIDGAVDFKQSAGNTTSNRIDLYGLMFYILVTVVSAVVIVYFFPSQARLLTDKALGEQTGINLLKGLALLLVWPILSLLLILTLLGSLPGFVLLLTYGIVFVVSMMLAPVLSGVILARWLKKRDDELKPAWASFGAITLTLIMYLPIFGFIVRGLLFLVSFYAVSTAIIDGVWKKRK